MTEQIYCIYCNPEEFAKYCGCGMVRHKSEWVERKNFERGNPLICPCCGKAGTGIKIDRFNYWKVRDSGQRKIAKKLLGIKD